MKIVRVAGLSGAIVFVLSLSLTAQVVQQDTPSQVAAPQTTTIQIIASVDSDDAQEATLECVDEPCPNCVRREVGVPFLSDIPYVNRLFKNVGIAPCEEHRMRALAIEAATPSAPSDGDLVVYPANEWAASATAATPVTPLDGTPGVPQDAPRDVLPPAYSAPVAVPVGHAQAVAWQPAQSQATAQAWQQPQPQWGAGSQPRTWQAQTVQAQEWAQATVNVAPSPYAPPATWNQQVTDEWNAQPAPQQYRIRIHAPNATPNATPSARVTAIGVPLPSVPCEPSATSGFAPRCEPLVTATPALTCDHPAACAGSSCANQITSDCAACPTRNFTATLPLVAANICGGQGASGCATGCGEVPCCDGDSCCPTPEHPVHGFTFYATRPNGVQYSAIASRALPTPRPIGPAILPPMRYPNPQISPEVVELRVRNAELQKELEMVQQFAELHAEMVEERMHSKTEMIEAFMELQSQYQNELAESKMEISRLQAGMEFFESMHEVYAETMAIQVENAQLKAVMEVMQQPGVKPNDLTENQISKEGFHAVLEKSKAVEAENEVLRQRIMELEQKVKNTAEAVTEIEIR